MQLSSVDPVLTLHNKKLRHEPIEAAERLVTTNVISNKVRGTRRQKICRHEEVRDGETQYQLMAERPHLFE